MIELNQKKVYDFICLMDSTGRMFSTAEGFVFFLRLDAGWLEKIRQKPSLLLNTVLMQTLLRKEGKNIHFIGIYGNENNKGFVSIRKGFREFVAKEKPISVSWFNKDMNKFNYRRLQWLEQ